MRAALLALPLLLPAAGSAGAVGAGPVAALQVALHARGVYTGPIDGVAGPATERGVVRFQRRAGLTVDGVVGPRTRRALGRLGRHPLGSRILHRGLVGWDVAELQFSLAWHGFPSGPFDGRLGRRGAGALRRFQHWAGLPVDGRAGPDTLAALSAAVPRSPLTLAWPVVGPLGDGFGPRGERFHAGVDILAWAGTPVTAAAAGRVAWSGWRDGWGLLVVIAHADGVRTFYAHLSEADVLVGQQVAAGAHVGLVGATGDATGPHLHFEVRVRSAAVDPLTALAPDPVQEVAH
jgi:peptidoglycan hydrolase-like protein with peptidoglycan-binding domain